MEKLLVREWLQKYTFEEKRDIQIIEYLSFEEG